MTLIFIRNVYVSTIMRKIRVKQSYVLRNGNKSSLKK